ncbi:hypothetical protein R1flu_021637 [Riccia fluitans]|uniref:Uncharacterized protein n=1 Tax=Riccia fluitans TaxID=41844 RepID=A0ABD1ZT49_9MARC
MDPMADLPSKVTGSFFCSGRGSGFRPRLDGGDNTFLWPRRIRAEVAARERRERTADSRGVGHFLDSILANWVGRGVRIPGNTCEDAMWRTLGKRLDSFHAGVISQGGVRFCQDLAYVEWKQLLHETLVLACTLCPNYPTMATRGFRSYHKQFLEYPRLDKSPVRPYLRASTSREPIQCDGTSLNSAWSSGIGARSYRGSGRGVKKKHSEPARKATIVPSGIVQRTRSAKSMT